MSGLGTIEMMRHAITGVCPLRDPSLWIHADLHESKKPDDKLSGYCSVRGIQTLFAMFCWRISILMVAKRQARTGVDRSSLISAIPRWWKPPHDIQE